MLAWLYSLHVLYFFALKGLKVQPCPVPASPSCARSFSSPGYWVGPDVATQVTPGVLSLGFRGGKGSLRSWEPLWHWQNGQFSQRGPFRPVTQPWLLLTGQTPLAGSCPSSSCPSWFSSAHPLLGSPLAPEDFCREYSAHNRELAAQGVPCGCRGCSGGAGQEELCAVSLPALPLGCSSSSQCPAQPPCPEPCRPLR